MTNTIEQSLLVLDGYYAAGKSTLARHLAEHLGGQYVKPYSGDIGRTIARLWKEQMFESLDKFARSIIEKTKSEHSDASLLVYDRHWMTVFTLLPEGYYERWFPLPPTFLCWTNAAVTQKRLIERGGSASELSESEKKQLIERGKPVVGDLAILEHQCNLFRNLADYFNISVIDTTHTTVPEALNIILTKLDKFNLSK